MAITIDGETKRNLPEQVKKNQDDIAELQASINEPKFEDIKGNATDNVSLKTELDSKVDKVSGKELSEANFTNEEKIKLASINMSTKQDKLSEAQMAAVNSGITESGYNDVTEVANEVFNREFKLITDTPTRLNITRDESGKTTKLTVIGGGGGGEPENYIKTITKGGSTYTAKRQDNSTVQWTIPDISGKQDKINDLGTIREGAGKGATALQPAALNDYRTSAAQDVIDTNITNNLNSEIVRATQAENDISDSVTAETTNRTNADNALGVRIDGKEDTISATHKIPYQYISGAPTVLIYKGTCLQANLPTSGQLLGDYWKLSDESGIYSGQCAIWSGTKWEYSSSSIDMSNYYNKTEADAKFATTTNLTAEETARTLADNALGSRIDEVEIDIEGEAALRESGDEVLEALIDGKSTVSVSNTGTATDLVQYITIDGVEKKLAGGGTGDVTKAYVDQQDQALLAEIQEVESGIPTKTSQLTNDSGFLTEHQSLADYRKSADQDTIDATFVTLGTDQTITANKKFTGSDGCWAYYNDAVNAKYKYNCIDTTVTGITYQLSFPMKNGTIALTNDISTALANYRTAADQDTIDTTITGAIATETTNREAADTTLQNNIDTKIAKTSTIETVWSGTLAEYNAITSKDAKTLYNITDDNALFNLQTFYDGLYPVGNTQFGLQAPAVPTGINATWTDVTSEFNGRYFKADSTNAAGTSQNAMLPKHYHSQISDGTWNLAKGGSGGTIGLAQAEGGAVYGNLMRTGDAIVSTSPNVDGGLELRPLTTTIKVYRRTA